MEFTKMQGAGNDFIIINNIKEKIPHEKLPDVARRLCSRRVSIGADGLMAVERAENGGDYRMLFFNSDGSAGEMCGNGARCICRYGYELGLAGDIQRVETTAGLVTGRRESERMYTVRLNDTTVIELDRRASDGEKEIICAYVELGNPGLPHAVVMYDGVGLASPDVLRRLGALLRHDGAFPKGANVNFCEVTGENTVRVRTYERGVEDLTLACGTGAGSTAAVMTLLGRVSGDNVKIEMDGGELYVTLTARGDTVRDIYLTGPTNIVARGEVCDEELYLSKR